MSATADTVSEEFEEGAAETYARADLARCIDARLHSLVIGILTVVLAVTALGIAGFSAAFGAQTTLAAFVETLTINAAWFYFSLFALVGLFVAYPAHQWQPNGAHREFTSEFNRFMGTLASRWLLLAGGVVVAFVFPFLVGLAVFDSFSLVVFLGVTVITVLTLCAYGSVGVAVAAVTRTDGRLVFWLLAIYWVLAFLWETSLVPLVIAMAATGDPEGAIGTPPTLHDVVLAMSPGGAHATLSNAIIDGSVGTVDVIGFLALLAWLVLPPLLAWLVVSRRLD